MAEQDQYDRYSIVLHAPSDFANRVIEFRKKIDFADFPTAPHVSLLYVPATADIPQLQARMGSFVAGCDPVKISFTDKAFRASEDGEYAGLSVVHTTELTTLRKGLFSILIAVTSPPATDRPFHPHLTLYQNADRTQTAKALELGPSFEVNGGFTAKSVDLVGLSGPPGRGVRHILKVFPFRELPDRD